MLGARQENYYDTSVASFAETCGHSFTVFSIRHDMFHNDLPYK